MPTAPVDAPGQDIGSGCSREIFYHGSNQLGLITGFDNSHHAAAQPAGPRGDGALAALAA